MDFSIHTSRALARLANTPATWSGVAIEGLYQMASADVFSGEIADAVPTLTVRESDVPGVKIGDPIGISGATHTVRAIEIDGSGLIRLRLYK